MFTGIVTDVGTIASVEGDGDIRATIDTSYDTSTIEIGASIACSGVCLTVVDKGENWISADVSRESLTVTNLSDWAAGNQVNLERAMKLGDELGGHIVTGHVDCVGSVTKCTPIDDSITLVTLVPYSFGRLVSPKASVTLNGVSLTVNQIQDSADGTSITVNLIPHTQEMTSFRAVKIGDIVNVEFDILARYVSRLQEKG